MLGPASKDKRRGYSFVDGEISSRDPTPRHADQNGKRPSHVQELLRIPYMTSHIHINAVDHFTHVMLRLTLSR